MAYEKLNLQDGQVLDAAALAHMEEGIANGVSSNVVINLQAITDQFSLNERLYSSNEDEISVSNYISSGKTVFVFAPYTADLGDENVVNEYGLYVFAGTDNGTASVTFTRLDTSDITPKQDWISCSGGEWFSYADLSRK